MELLIFAGLALVAGVSGLLVVVQRHAVYSALFLILTMGALAGIYILLDAHFVWVIQVIVYAGAIMVLFLFVIMLLDIRREQAPWSPPDRGRILVAVLLSAVLLLELGIAVARRFVLVPTGGPAAARHFGTTQTVGRLLFTDFLFPFEITSIILLVAMIGAMVLAKKRLT
ncbi:MAG: NADH-quinone oxidoreductase subunit J [candidate division NC10 bacterium]|nr:NADH-quinone oxidoreductase subunit J [candidate division NC10 bacterium]MBI2458417.1 NADH-quinone oxidoreductase subunit J [candidate division NC10 bacterium]MBI3085046.1 NADH-quinone oxidoreductase subunit J [candidate division NC10 bacterium]